MISDVAGLDRDHQQISRSIGERLSRLYPAEVADRLRQRLCALASATRMFPLPEPVASGWSERDALIITYADTVTEAGVAPLVALRRFLRAHLGDAVTMVHLLPCFPFSSDDGFSVIDYRSLRPDLGKWSDVAELARHYRLAFDAVVNHASRHSAYVRGHCAGEPAFVDFAVVVPPGMDTSRVLRTRSLPLTHPFETVRGVEQLWTTFSADQVDLNFKNPEVLFEITDVLLYYVGKGASVLRLDAIPYLWKEAGTSCAHLPQTHEVIKLWREVLDLAAPRVLLLTETNVPHAENVSYFGDRGDEAQIIYNFSLPPLLLWTLHTGSAAVLTRWARDLSYVGPRATYLNITSTHDGIGMRPTEGVLTEEQRQELCALARRHGGDITGKRNSDGSVSVYELNITYFDALNDPNGATPLDIQIARFVLSQAVPMALMGVPAFYLPSLLGSRNDLERVQATGRIRSINRPELDGLRIGPELEHPASFRARVFAPVKRLLQIRATLPAFHPDSRQQIIDAGPSLFIVRREHPTNGQVVIACHNVTAGRVAFELPAGGWRSVFENRPASRIEELPGYAVRWFVL